MNFIKNNGQSHRFTPKTHLEHKETKESLKKYIDIHTEISKNLESNEDAPPIYTKPRHPNPPSPTCQAEPLITKKVHRAENIPKRSINKTIKVAKIKLSITTPTKGRSAAYKVGTSRKGKTTAQINNAPKIHKSKS